MIIKKLRTESLTGLMLGLAGGAAVAAVAAIWLRDIRLVCCLLGGIVGGVACAAVVGTLLPNLLRLMRREPQVAAGPIALAITDMLTLLIYFSLARSIIA